LDDERREYSQPRRIKQGRLCRIQAKKILVVDDKSKIREVVRSYLENEGYGVVEAANGKDALAVFQKTDLTLVVLDLMLPDLSGKRSVRLFALKLTGRNMGKY